MYEINNTAYIVQMRIKICHDILTDIKIYGYNTTVLNDSMQTFHVMVVNIQEYFPEVP